MNKLKLTKEQRRLIDDADHVNKTCAGLFEPCPNEPVRVLWKDLEDLSFGERLYVAPGIYMTKIDSIFDDGMIFFVEMDHGTSFSFHDHDCFELYLIIEGEIEGVIGGKYYKPFQAHEPKAIGRTRLFVKLSKTAFKHSLIA